MRREPEVIQASLRDEHVLLVVDGCDHLVDTIAKSAEILLQNAPNLHILATSKRPLGAEGESLYRLAPLSVPDGETISAETARTFSAVQLFAERASAACRTFRFDDASLTNIVEICRRLDGMPLAIELAAARVSPLGLGGVLRGLAERFTLLTIGRRTALPRHQTLKATIDWSHSLLDDEERELFRRPIDR